MTKVTLAHVDAFTDHMFGGNPAGVVPEASTLHEEQMQNIARELNLSETAFVFPSTTADFRLRFFTPISEIKFCGHATVASLHFLSQQGYFNMHEPGVYSFKVETNAGVLKMSVNKKGNDDIAIQFESPKIDLVVTSYTHKLIAKELGLNISYLDQTKPIMLERTNQYLYFCAKSLPDLGKITYDLQKAKRFCQIEKVNLFCVLTTETFDPANQAHSRVFVPEMGIAEDPVTGSSAGGLVTYLTVNGILPPNLDFIGLEQGHFMQRAGGMKVKLERDGKDYSATIYARAVTVFSTDSLLIFDKPN